MKTKDVAGALELLELSRLVIVQDRPALESEAGKGVLFGYNNPDNEAVELLPVFQAAVASVPGSQRQSWLSDRLHISDEDMTRINAVTCINVIEQVESGTDREELVARSDTFTAIVLMNHLGKLLDCAELMEAAKSEGGGWFGENDKRQICIDKACRLLRNPLLLAVALGTIHQLQTSK